MIYYLNLIKLLEINNKNTLQFTKEIIKKEFIRLYYDFDHVYIIIEFK